MKEHPVEWHPSANGQADCEDRCECGTSDRNRLPIAPAFAGIDEQDHCGKPGTTGQHPDIRLHTRRRHAGHDTEGVPIANNSLKTSPGTGRESGLLHQFNLDRCPGFEAEFERTGLPIGVLCRQLTHFFHFAVVVPAIFRFE
jgi:hypothetical protein